MKKIGRVFALLLGAGIMAGSASGSPIFNLIGTSGNVGDGNLSVPISQTGGWGFQIMNDSLTEWIGANVSDFCPSGVSTPPCDANTWFLAGVDTFGPYTDFYGANFVVVGPGQTLRENFDSSGSSGAGSITLSRAGIKPGDQQSGNIVFVYDFYDGDPNAGGNQIGGDQTALASATVTAVVISPEPASWGLMAAACILLAGYRRHGAARQQASRTGGRFCRSWRG